MFCASSYPSSGATTTAVVAASGLPSELRGSSAVGRGRAGWPDHDLQHCYHHVPPVNQRLLLQLLFLLMMGMRMPETCWAVSKQQAINLWSCCILLVDSVETRTECPLSQCGRSHHWTSYTKETEKVCAFNTNRLGSKTKRKTVLLPAVVKQA
jgi:hypothetical protein